jgi:hypothetical protein
MRNLQSRLIQFDAIKQQKVKVERSGPVADASPAIAPEFKLDGKQPVEQLPGLQFRLDGDGGVDEARLVSIAHRLGPV